MKDIQGKNVLTYRKMFSLFLLCHKNAANQNTAMLLFI